MMPLLLLVAALIGWSLWTKRITTAQLVPIILTLAGAFVAVRGQWVLGGGAMVIGVLWFAGQARRLMKARAASDVDYAILEARHLLGISADDGPDRIKARHRHLIAQNHPDAGGDPVIAQKLNEARDLLLHDLETKLH